MIKNSEALSIPEVRGLLGEIEETEKSKQLEAFIKKFSKLKPEKAKEIREKLTDSGILKLNSEHIVKIIDILPEDASDVNKIASDAGLDEEEITKILEIVKKYG